ncbi:Acyltransferase [Carpediemonas membranifera]|uniref:Acyltransferase n=1 Tax=Carpediemonas membranifera TaxID=201153 RepID=A0A8J6AQI2_9EUKA|nr:Acyltransferase [Carpediemonas membranifera]|eukprot:KAG9391063.1 Acyltransferase [Carpediemonas membranifera]
MVQDENRDSSSESESEFMSEKSSSEESFSLQGDPAEQSAFIAPANRQAEKKMTIALETEVLRGICDHPPLPPTPGQPSLFAVNMVLESATQAVQSIVQDQFSECFETPKSLHWNWNLWLMIGYIIGVIFRTFFVLPIRLTWVLIFAIMYFMFFFAIWGAHFLFHPPKLVTKRRIQAIGGWCARCILSSWSSVIVYHGVIPARRPNQIYVANHTSLVDFPVLMGAQPFSTIGQQQPGWIGGMQFMLKFYDCVWFNRLVANDRHKVLEAMKDHVADATKAPMLVFPEGVCVNNKFTVQFKVGAFQLGAEVCPIAIKYNTVFSNVYWNSKRESFTKYVLKLWHGWAIVGDVYFLPPMSIEPDETPQQFAGRVKEAISRKARLRSTEWNGYLKYFKPNKRFTDNLQKVQADIFLDQIAAYWPELYESVTAEDEDRKRV